MKLSPGRREGWEESVPRLGFYFSLPSSVLIGNKLISWKIYFVCFVYFVCDSNWCVISLSLVRSMSFLYILLPFISPIQLRRGSVRASLMNTWYPASVNTPQPLTCCKKRNKDLSGLHLIFSLLPQQVNTSGAGISKICVRERDSESHRSK